MKSLHIRIRLLSAIAAAFAAVVLMACGGSATRTGSSGPTPAERARADSTNWPYTKADIDFMSGMIHHHAQAIAMAELAPKNDASPAVRTLSARIINAQTDEITIMQQWLRERNQPVPVPNPKGMRMVMNGVEHDMLMPGMLSETQMKELAAARGKEFDRLMLTLMIQHHEGAIKMVKDLISAAGAAQDETVFKIASDISADQEIEIARMRTILFNMANTP